MKKLTLCLLAFAIGGFVGPMGLTVLREQAGWPLWFTAPLSFLLGSGSAVFVLYTLRDNIAALMDRIFSQ